MTSIVFPGQGSQYVDMGCSLFEEFPDITQDASGCLGYSTDDLCCQNRDSKLDKTEFSQPAIYVANALSWLKEKTKSDEPVGFFLGHSLGEYNALLVNQIASPVQWEQNIRHVMAEGESGFKEIQFGPRPIWSPMIKQIEAHSGRAFRGVGDE